MEQFWLSIIKEMYLFLSVENLFQNTFVFWNNIANMDNSIHVYKPPILGFRTVMQYGLVLRTVVRVFLADFKRG